MSKRIVILLFALCILAVLTSCQPIGYIVVTATPPPQVIIVTATPEQFETATPVVTEDGTPTQEVWVSPHQQCAVEHVNSCIVNENPTLVGGTIRHTMWNGRNTDIPEGYRFAPVTSPSPFVYCYASLPGCRFEFQWLQGNLGYQAEDVTIYPDTVYLIKLVYSLNAACSQGNNCSADQLSVGSQVFINDSRTRLNNQPVPARVGQNFEAIWAIRLPAGDYYATAAIQVYLSVQWATFANPANFIIHEISIIAQPSDYRGYIYPLNNA